MAPRNPRSVRIGGDDLVALREIVVIALLAPAADAIAGGGSEIDAPVSEVRRATALLGRTGWPGEPAVAVDLPPAEAALGRTAVLIALSGAAERVWEASADALDGCGPFDGREAVVDVVRAARLLAILSGEEPAGLAPPDAARADRTILEAFPDGILVLGRGGVLAWANQRACDLLGEASHGMADQPDRWLADRARALAGAVEATAAAAGEHHVRLPGPAPGETVALTARVADLPGGERVVVLRPGGERRPVPRAPRDGEEAFRLLMDATPAMIWTTGPDGAVTYANAATCRMLGLPPDDILGDGWLAAVHPDDLPAVRAGFRAALDEQRDVDLEFRLLRPGGGETRVVSRGAARLDADRGFLGYVGALHDIRARRRAQDPPRAPGPGGDAPAGPLVWTCDRRGAMDHLGVAWLRLTGRDAHDDRGHGWLLAVHPGDRPRVAEAVAAAAAHGTPLDSVHRVRHRDGTHRWVRMAGVPRTRPGGTPAGLVGTCEDVTVRAAAARRDAAVSRLLGLLAATPPLPDLAARLAAEAGALLDAWRVEVVTSRRDTPPTVVGAWSRDPGPAAD
ncbi:MAG: PAS domain-containing protein, partial [Actinomycetota bacterium]